MADSPNTRITPKSGPDMVMAMACKKQKIPVRQKPDQAPTIDPMIAALREFDEARKRSRRARRNLPNDDLREIASTEALSRVRSAEVTTLEGALTALEHHRDYPE